MGVWVVVLAVSREEMTGFVQTQNAATATLAGGQSVTAVRGQDLRVWEGACPLLEEVAEGALVGDVVVDSEVAEEAAVGLMEATEDEVDLVVVVDQTEGEWD